MMKVKSNNIVRNLAETKDLCTPNLLVNSDFKSGIINQRGQASYTGNSSKNTYTVDRWYITRSMANTLTVNDGYVTASLPTDQSFGQFLEFSPSGAMTVAIKLKDTDLKVFTLDNYESNGGTLLYDFGDIEEGFSIKLRKTSDNDKWIFFLNNLSSETKTANIEYIKLEKGSVFTGMPQWDEPIEYLKCRKYFYTLGGGWNNMFHARTDENYISIYIPILTPMAKTPSLVDYGNESSPSKMVSVRGNDIAQGTSLSVPISEFTQSANKTGVTLSAPLNGRSQIGYGSAVFRFACGLDAEMR